MENKTASVNIVEEIRRFVESECNKLSVNLAVRNKLINDHNKININWFVK
jgi:hypothetical protein